MPNIDIVIAPTSTRTPSLEKEIRQHVAAGKLGNRQVDEARIRPVPKTGATWHSNASDPIEHITVDFKKDGKHVTTHHVRRST